MASLQILRRYWPPTSKNASVICCRLQTRAASLDVDPHAGAIPWPGPSVTSINQPIDLGPFEDASPCRVLFMRRHGLFGGTAGSGKSGGLNALMGNLAACRDVVIWAIDLKKGMELGPWEPCIGRLATTPEQAVALLRDAVAILETRAESLAAAGRRVWEISPDVPALVIIIDEYAELADEAPTRCATPIPSPGWPRGGRNSYRGYAAAHPKGHGPRRGALSDGSADMLQGPRAKGRGPDPGTGNAPGRMGCPQPQRSGKFLVSAPGHDSPKRARAYLLTDEGVTGTAARYAGHRPELDTESQRAILAPANPRPFRKTTQQTTQTTTATHRRPPASPLPPKTRSGSRFA
jgi:FtsK/SpoIIIE family